MFVIEHGLFVTGDPRRCGWRELDDYAIGGAIAGEKGTERVKLLRRRLDIEGQVRTANFVAVLNADE